MKTWHWIMRALGCDQRGATAIEYALIAALIALAIIVAVGSVGTSLQSMFGSLANNAAWGT